jgi:hypothetical protein|tara:strand:- start:2749 stop:3489 length:741 start_codon:yes stop_codon:yes gene_type:complete
MSNNVSSFISKLDKLNDKSLEVFVPSKNKKVKVKPLTLKQQKDLISSVLDGVKGSLNFSQTLNNIIIDNSGLADLKVVDKIPFAVAMRIEALGDKYAIEDVEASLQVILDNVQAVKLELEYNQVINYKDLAITLTVPTLQEENALLAKSESDLTKEDGTLREEVAMLYLIEIVKYIQKLEIGGQSVNMSEIKIPERINLVEKLPLAVYTDISNYIETVNGYIKSLLTVGDGTVSVDALFFDSTSTE